MATIDLERFRKEIRQIIHFSDKSTSRYAWSLIKNMDEFEPYMSMKYIEECTTVDSENNSPSINDIQSDLYVLDSAELSSSIPLKTDILTYEFHVLYSLSYSVPVLYFNIYHSDGRLIPLEKVWDYVPKEYNEHLQSEKWSMITQQEHPVLGRPFYQLHPCHTAELMSKLPSDRNFIGTWLSAIGPIVGLELPVSFYASLT